MQKGLCILLFLLFAFDKLSAAPAMAPAFAVEVTDNSTDYKKENYKKKSLKQRLNNFIIRTILKLSGKQIVAEPATNEKIEKKALWAKWLGIGSLIALLIPGLNLLSLPAAVAAIILGSETLRRTAHPGYARQGIIFGCITAGLLLVVGVIVALVTLLPVR